MKNPLVGRDLISISDLSIEETELILRTALVFQKESKSDLLKGSILASCFFEPSTRTRLSFESAMHRLGGAVIGFSEPSTTSMKKGESLFDSMRVIGSYADILVIRHPQEGSAAIAARAAASPVLNAGDGTHQHPTQTLIDLFTIQECQGTLKNLRIAMAGDLKYGRTIHSLCLALAQYPVRLYFIAPENLGLPIAIIQELKKRGIEFSVHETLEEVIPFVDILYMTRTQKERFPENGMDPSNTCLLKKKHLDQAKKNFRILHPLPRLNEIEESIDETPFANYFQQAANGIPVRMALLALTLKEKVPH
jgi:aspartate carbamoyltransferase catalytic subunit